MTLLIEFEGLMPTYDNSLERSRLCRRCLVRHSATRLKLTTQNRKVGL